jgi:hypothetical protein
MCGSETLLDSELYCTGAPFPSGLYSTTLGNRDFWCVTLELNLG